MFFGTKSVKITHLNVDVLAEPEERSHFIEVSLTLTEMFLVDVVMRKELIVV